MVISRTIVKENNLRKIIFLVNMINLNKKQVWTCFHWQEARSGNIDADSIIKKLFIREDIKELEAKYSKIFNMNNVVITIKE